MKIDSYSFGRIVINGKTYTVEGIEVKVERTSKAVEVYNDLEGVTNVIAALHLTC